MNNIRVFMLMAALTALLMGVGGAIGGQGGMLIAFVLAAGTNIFALFFSDKMVLRAYKAQVVTEREAPELYRMVDRLRQRAGLPMPTVAIAPHAQPNAFATGRSPERAVVCVTQGLMSLVNSEELEGVVAHELAHIKNRDMLLQTVTATIAGAISNLAFFGYFMGGRGGQSNALVQLAMLILAPIAAALVQMAISRQREFKADAVGAEICGRPLALASALQKLEAGARRIPMEVSPAVAPVAQVNPLAAHGSGMARLFSTHPPIAERVSKLQALAA
jgi:heat shock protein HtpX